MIIRFVEI